MEFFEALKSRRSVRVFLNESVPASVIETALDAALLAPNSSNMQTWEFYWVQKADTKSSLVKACLNQSAARSAQELIVAVANPRKWKDNNPKMLAHLQKTKVPAQVLDYYSKLMPFIYGKQWLAPVKWLIFNGMGIFKPTPRHPWSYRDRQEVAIKSCALACQNLMLAMRAQGYDTCPMEGFDESRVKSLLKLSCGARVVMVLAVGKRSPEGIWGEQIRFAKELFIKKI